MIDARGIHWLGTRSFCAEWRRVVLMRVGADARGFGGGWRPRMRETVERKATAKALAATTPPATTG